MNRQRIMTISGWGLALLLAALFLGMAFQSRDSLAWEMGKAVCHHIPAHSFHRDGVQYPLCQRCSGTFPAIFSSVLILGMVFLVRRRVPDGLPPVPVLILTGLFLAFLAFDGLNSWSALRGASETGWFGYAPRPELRLMSGSLAGLGIVTLLLPLLPGLLPEDAADIRPLGTGLWLVTAGVMGLQGTALVFFHQEVATLLALWGALGEFCLLVLAGTMAVRLLFFRGDHAASWQESLLMAGWGSAAAMAWLLAAPIIRG